MSRLLSSSEANEFKEILNDYELHEVVLEQFRSSNFGVIAGPAGAGKDTLRNELVGKFPDGYLQVLSTTTRPPRKGETDGVTYHFREIEAVKAGLEKRLFFQAELVHEQQVSCLDINEIKKLRPDQWGLSILITATEKKLRAIKPDIKTIFLIPPTFDELLKRMQAERMLDDQEIDRRLQAAEAEIGHALESDTYVCIISDSIAGMVEKANNFFQQGIGKSDTGSRDIMKSIIGDIQKRQSLNT